MDEFWAGAKIGIYAGLIGGLVVLVVAILKPAKSCEKCGKRLPKIRWPGSKRQAISGGTTCPHCGQETR